MPYCTIADVKPLLQISPSESEFDAEIDACIASAEAIVDSALKAAGLAVPSAVPIVVHDAAACFAAWLFRRRRDPAAAEVFWQDANRFLDAYIEAEVKPYVGRV